MLIDYRSINCLWEDSRRSGVLTLLYRERVDEWRLLKCVKVYAKQRGSIRNIRLVKIVERIGAWLRMHVSEAYRRARARVREFSQAKKYRLGVWGSAGLRGELLGFYFSLKNARVPKQLLVELYMD